MDKIFKRNSKKPDPQNSDNESSTANSVITEHIIPSSPKSPAFPKPVRPRLNDQDVQKHTSVTWPRLPQLALTTSQDSQTYGPLDFPESPSSHPIEVLYTDTEAGSDAELNNSAQKHRRRISYDEDDGSCSDVGSLNNDRHKNGNQFDDSGANTLVEAALDKEEAKYRHIRFQDHVAESAALVQRMLSMKSGQRQAPDALQTAMLNRHDSRNSDEEISLHQKHPNLGGGSVLASLMRLEAARVDGENKKKTKRPKERKSLNLKRNKNRPASLFNLSVHSNTDPGLQPPRPKRPPLVKRPSSWLSEVASSKYLVPSLEKRKKFASPSFSRRSSNDSMFTTASQFEPITLDDRIRITFEIANILQKQEFLRKLCKSLMLYGCPAHRLEYAMRQVSRTLAVEAEYVYIPSVMLVTFIDSTTHTTETHFIRQSQTFEMHRLSDIYRLEKLVAHGEVSVDEALEFIDKVYDQPPLYPLWLHPIVYALASFSGCILFFGGRWKEAGVAAALGIFFASNELFSKTIASFQPIWEITVCILIGFVARGITKYDFCFTPIAFSSFIIVLPGYPMAVAIIELVSRQLVSGVVRMVYAIIYSFLLGYGVSMGSQLYLTIDKNSTLEQSDACKLASSATTCVSSESQWFNFLMVPLFAMAFCIFLRARLPRWPIMTLVASFAYVINYALACWAHAPSQILQVAPAFGLGLVGNLLSKFTGKMSFDAVLLGVFYLVPSILGLKAAIGLFSGSEEVGTQGAGFALAMIESSIGITLGLFLATLIVYPKGTQHTPLMSL
ncbi:uncharacterized protein EV154DRAFT_215922 [Mucor mucedo]|uniref:uncharacterized protein n=1 Tax=Mucor mucedo TaxID=29922 RepID=UPI00221F4BE4|nr:uncharacterized protein EV154DRAFT_215922 [Mucor mucedo]KAI7891759.1 hypothetical protein EV154DRAFT_215922 [Mucor mucedo]